MDINQLKIELLQKIIECDDEKILLKIEELLDKDSLNVEDPSEEYKVSSATVPDYVYGQLHEDFEKYKKGELKAKSWQEVKAMLEEKHGL